MDKKVRQNSRVAACQPAKAANETIAATATPPWKTQGKAPALIRMVFVSSQRFVLAHLPQKNSVKRDARIASQSSRSSPAHQQPGSACALAPRELGSEPTHDDRSHAFASLCIAVSSKGKVVYVALSAKSNHLKTESQERRSAMLQAHVR